VSENVSPTDFIECACGHELETEERSFTKELEKRGMSWLELRKKFESYKRRDLHGGINGITVIFGGKPWL
jgi:hypothetical protein